PTKTHSPTIVESLEWKRALNPQLSPDGRSVAYEIQETDWQADEFTTAIWLADTGSGENTNRQLVKRGSAPTWSPDGKLLAFLNDEANRQQICVVDPASGQSHLVTRADSPISRISWSPGGRRIAFTTLDPESPERQARHERDGKIEASG